MGTVETEPKTTSIANKKVQKPLIFNHVANLILWCSLIALGYQVQCYFADQYLDVIVGLIMVFCFWLGLKEIAKIQGIRTWRKNEAEIAQRAKDHFDTEKQLGDYDPELKKLYDAIMDTWQVTRYNRALRAYREYEEEHPIQDITLKAKIDLYIRQMYDAITYNIEDELYRRG